ncbi:MAG: WD40/YVTN/BNR-like repeat-containing protein [Pseudomonadota bacterium]
MKIKQCLHRLLISGLLLPTIGIAAQAAEPPELQQLNTVRDQMWIGAAPVSRATVWLAGENGLVAYTRDGGKSWNYSQPGQDDLQFRDIEAIDDRQAYAVSIGDDGESKVYFTDNRGDSWRMRYRADSDTFLNCMATSPNGEAWIFGDTVGDEWRIIRSPGGRNWMKAHSAVSEEPLANEGGFASSGSCVRFNNDTWLVGTGNADTARVLRKGGFGIRFDVIDSPMKAGPGAGIFAVWPVDDEVFYIAGGNMQTDEEQGQRLWRYDGEQFQAVPKPPLEGALYSLSVIDHQGRWLLTSNKSGAAAYHEPTETWHKLTDAEVWNIQCHSDISCWLVGNDGFVAKLIWKPAPDRRANAEF